MQLTLLRYECHESDSEMRPTLVTDEVLITDKLRFGLLLKFSLSRILNSSLYFMDMYFFAPYQLLYLHI